MHVWRCVYDARQFAFGPHREDDGNSKAKYKSVVRVICGAPLEIRYMRFCCRADVFGTLLAGRFSQCAQSQVDVIVLLLPF